MADNFEYYPYSYANVYRIHDTTKENTSKL